METRLEQVERRLDQLATRVDSELRADTVRFDAMVRSSDRAFSVLALLGAFGSFLGGMIVVLSWLRGRKVDERHRQDYEREREFYEKRAMEIERRQNETHVATLEVSRAAATRDSSFAQQQLQLGENVLSRSGDMLTRQIDGIEKLGGVIELVKKTFEMQLTRVGDVEKLLQRLGETDEVVASFTKHFREQYRHVRELMFTFRHHSRVDWTKLTDQEVTVASRALTIFETIPNSVLDSLLREDSGKNRFELAQVYQLLGVGAFYSNDIDAAARYLERGLEIYGNDDAPAESLFPQAFCSHFLGLVEKNWCHVDRPLEANLAAARKHFEEAARRQRTREGEFLTPVTLAEVLSYSEQTASDALAQLQDILDRLNRVKSKQALDENQQMLLGRALLLMGNLEFAAAHREQALSWYTKANEHNTRNAYAILSMAQATDPTDAEVRMERFRSGLASLENSGALSKQENTARLLAVAWAMIAASEIGDESVQRKYTREMELATAYVRPVGGRAPLFFCPVTKKLVTFEQLRANVSAYVKTKVMAEAA
jgi:tetratricopeptide (TPR) repeat protein